ncbi:hypothetical protein HRR83_002517 [Exophiala dermatitidis]|uniref:Uncharacterized protein n=1 Tax=Exophiala dermatitidis TaxID=5970 RepID=A0AAN6EVP3_EXODE|nr:hypothetical protein HRR74_002594 [Exophiala dermatitidis]KAJ4555754.1 hypothetical protein HRR77_001680 [Exophiala dermatitidis]KAJ4556118.1 hypothetical protein HRR78_001776 [Exophiala dermatitidis]KAJ4569054.1 hypothetical protein HRR81_006712 [Exophiala dermatitidis]KAJ4571927.1 hypothetical protein HRR79_003137 [Exophiala dermatitidis]
MHFLSIWAAGLTLSPGIAYAATQLSFFEHNSCNAGTSFEQYTDYNVLTADTSCHQLPNGTVAFYVNQIDQGCSIRSYTSSNCDPSSSSLAGVLIGVGTCFYIDEGVDLGSWRPDCPGVDYSSTNGLDTSNSYTSTSSNNNGSNGNSSGSSNSTITITSAAAPGQSSNSGADAAVQSVIKTATGAVTFTPVTTSTTSASASDSGSGSGSGSDSTSAAASGTGTGTGTVSGSATGTANTSTSTNGAAGLSMGPLMTSFGTVMAAFALLG